MSFFDAFRGAKLSKSLPNEYIQARGRSRDLLDADQPREAFSAFRSQIEYPAKIGSEVLWKDAFTYFVQIAHALGAKDLAKASGTAARKPKNIDAQFNFAFQLYESGLHGIAALVLSQVIERTGGDADILPELVCNLEAMMLFDDAVRLLEEHRSTVQRSTLLQYLLGFNLLMTGDVSGASSQTRRLAGADPDEFPMVPLLNVMVERAEGLSNITSLDRRDLIGWHFALNGSILLSRSPQGLEEGMNGRYAFTTDSYSNCALGISRLLFCLHTAGLQPQRVVGLPDRGSQALAIATARRLGVKYEDWAEDGATQPGLFVAYDLEDIAPSVSRSLENHAPDQLLWSHASCWTVPLPISADFITFLYQLKVAPWEQGLLDGSPADDSPADVLAEHILKADGDAETLEDEPLLQRLVAAAIASPTKLKPAFLNSKGPRNQQRQGSPVPSSRFI